MTAKERRIGREVHDSEREAIRASVAFGRRTKINPAVFPPTLKPRKHRAPFGKDTKEVINQLSCNYVFCFGANVVPTY